MNPILKQYRDELLAAKKACDGRLYPHAIRSASLDFWKRLTRKHGDTTLRHMDAIVAIKNDVTEEVEHG